MQAAEPRAPLALWLTGLQPRAVAVLAVLAGISTGAGQAPLSAWPLALAGLALAMGLFLAAADIRGAGWRFWLFGLGYFTATLFWIVEPFMVDPLRHGWMAPFALVFMAGGMALFWGAAGALARYLAGNAPPWRALAALVLTLSGAELLRSYIFTGFPWALISYIWIGAAPAQMAAVIGPHGLVLVTLVIVALLAMALWRGRLMGMIWPVVALAAIWAYGLQALRGPEPAATGAIVRVVQPNAPQHQKWQPEYAQLFFDRLLEFTAAPGAGDARPDLVIWPETAIPLWLDQAEGAMALMAEAAGGTRLVFGVNAYDAPRAYNAMVVLGGDGTLIARYDKYRLVPFGEYIPAGGLLSRIGFRAFTQQAGYGFSPGPGPEQMALGAAGNALPLICYEAIFPQAMRGAGRPDWLMQITNDAWFGALAGPQQHLAQARMRAIEQGLPLIRSANTGISAVIDTRGRIVRQIALNEAGWFDTVLPGPASPTPYARTGDWPMGALVLAGLAALMLRRAGSGKLAANRI